MNIDGAVRVEGWERFSWLRAGFSARCGGVSSAYGGKSLNLGWKEEDTDANVSENRHRFLHAICGDSDGGSRPSLVRSLATVRQVHGSAVQVVRKGDGPLATESGRAVLEGDGLLTNVPEIMLGVQVADCVPVLVADWSRRVVGAFHAGWRGALAQIVERGIARMREEYGSRPEQMVAAVGPSIGPCCYSVGEEVRSSFEGQFGYGAELFQAIATADAASGAGPGGRAEASGSGGHVSLNLWEANRRQLIDAGIPIHSVTVLGECTACARDRSGERKYFSHRAERGFAGRMMGAIGVVEATT